MKRMQLAQTHHSIWREFTILYQLYKARIFKLCPNCKRKNSGENKIKTAVSIQKKLGNKE